MKSGFWPSQAGGLLLLPLRALALVTGSKSFAHPVTGFAALNRRGLHAWRSRAEVAALPAISREMREGDPVTRRIALTPAVLARDAALATLLDHPSFQALTRYIASTGAEPMASVQTILLHDVAEAGGPLTYVPGSHRLTRRRLAWQRADSRRASLRRSGGASPSRPFAAAPMERLLPMIRRRKVTLQWWLQDLLAPLGLLRAVWHEAPRGAFDPGVVTGLDPAGVSR